jgi:arylsulfatase A-like enzyme
MMRQGMTFDNFTVVDSLCCPSRASTFTGQFPHNTRVVQNVAPYGGYVKFHRLGDDTRTFAVAMHAAGVRTALGGKYLNGYTTAAASTDGAPNNPPGWDAWAAIDGGGYNEFDYNVIRNASIEPHGDTAADYATTVLQRFGTDFVASATAPFFIELASYSPHSPYVPAPSDVGSFSGLPLPRSASFNKHPTAAPTWIAKLARIGPAGIGKMTRAFRERVEAVQSIDRMIGALHSSLAATGALRNTVFVFSSDNGFHMGEHGLAAGKLTAFDTDVRVPLIVTGPGIRPGTVDHHIVENVDLAPTFDNLTGAHVPATVDGRSIVPLLERKSTPWRTFAIIEHFRRPSAASSRVAQDPDRQNAAQGFPPSYQALRTATFTYVRYVDGEREFYDRRTDPFEMHNVYRTLAPMRIRSLNNRLHALHSCVGAGQCWTEALNSATNGR